MIFNALSGSSGQVPVTPIGGNRMHYAYALCVYRASQANSCTLEKVPWLYHVQPSLLFMHVQMICGCVL